MAPVFAVAAYYLALLNPRDALHAQVSGAKPCLDLAGCDHRLGRARTCRRPVLAKVPRRSSSAFLTLWRPTRTPRWSSSIRLSGVAGSPCIGPDLTRHGA